MTEMLAESCLDALLQRCLAPQLPLHSQIYQPERLLKAGHQPQLEHLQSLAQMQLSDWAQTLTLLETSQPQQSFCWPAPARQPGALLLSLLRHPEEVPQRSACLCRPQQLFCRLLQRRRVGG